MLNVHYLNNLNNLRFKMKFNLCFVQVKRFAYLGTDVINVEL